MTLGPIRFLIALLGGALSGKSGPKPTKKGRATTTGAEPTGDDCNLVFDVDLTSLRPAVRDVTLGETLDVELATEQDFDAVVCKRRADGAIVGSLAAFQGLSDLVGCMKRGHRYTAVIVKLGRTACRVHVTRKLA